MKNLLHNYICILLLLICLTSLFSGGCVSSRFNSPEKKFPVSKLQQDYTILREILEKYHPSLYWYTPKDSMNAYFAEYYAAIKDSMNRQQFGFKILAPLTTHLRCGHTSFNYPKHYNHQRGADKTSSFPLLLKIWPDTMVVLANLNKKDSILTRGTVVTAIDQYTEKTLTDTLFQFMPTDGYAENVNYVRLSSALPYYYKNILGQSPDFQVSYLDSLGNQRQLTIPAYNPAADSNKTNAALIPRSGTRAKSKKWEDSRNLKIDTSTSLAIMSIHTFGGGTRLPHFYKRNFRVLRKKGIKHLVIDLRNNGGGKVNNYTSLARYIKSHPFKVADTVTATHKGLGRYSKYISNGWINSLVLHFIAYKEKDSAYHFRYWEKHVFNPRKKNHYNGKVYVLINGPTFSASTLFAHTVKGQANVTLIGEEAGGGWHGNNGILIPDIILPNTKMRVRLPLFRIVQYQHVAKNGQGVMPDIYVPPTVENIRKGVDGKMQKVFELIQAEYQSIPHPIQ